MVVFSTPSGSDFACILKSWENASVTNLSRVPGPPPLRHFANACYRLAQGHQGYAAHQAAGAAGVVQSK